MRIRRRLFRILLDYLKKHPSRVIARLELKILMIATGRAFQHQESHKLFHALPLLKWEKFAHSQEVSLHKQEKHDSPCNSTLEEYALYTIECAQKPYKAARLYRTFYRLGRALRQITGFQDPADLSDLVFYLYRNIGITMDGELPGKVTVHRCFFSHYYSPEICKKISLLDKGLILGICGDGDFCFTERITEGCKACKAQLSGNLFS